MISKLVHPREEKQVLPAQYGTIAWRMMLAYNMRFGCWTTWERYVDAEHPDGAYRLVWRTDNALRFGLRWWHKHPVGAPRPTIPGFVY